MRFTVFFIGLAVAIGGAVSVTAQDRDVRIFGGGAQLGIRVSDTANGVRVDEVNAGSPAEKAGIREGDLVVEFDGERVRSAMQLARLVRETPEGRQVAVVVMRDGKRQTLQATPEARTFADLPREFRVVPPEFHVVPPEFNFRYDDRPRRLEVSRGRLGVTVQPLTPELEEYFGATNGGALVSSVAQDSAAARAGIRAGDVITSINGRQVSNSDDLMRELRDLTGEVTIVVLRDKKEMTFKATMAEAPVRRRGMVLLGSAGLTLEFA